MKVDLWLFALLGLANATALGARNLEGPVATTAWHPKTNYPELLSLRVDQKCATGTTTDDDGCQSNNYALRLERGIAIVTPYNRWSDPKLPNFFVDDDTQLYTVSKQPLQLYIDSITGALKYAQVGWLPPGSIALSFYKTGSNPLGLIDPSPACLSWPSTLGIVSFLTDPWWLCPLGKTGQYQVFISKDNYAQATGLSAVKKDLCVRQSLAAVNANPWKKGGKPPPR